MDIWRWRLAPTSSRFENSWGPRIHIPTGRIARSPICFEIVRSIVCANYNSHTSAGGDSALDVATRVTFGVFGYFSPSSEKYDSPVAESLLLALLVAVVLVLLNVLIAILGDSFDGAMVRTEQLFAQARFDLVNDVLRSYPRWCFRCLAAEEMDALVLRSKQTTWGGRILETVQRVRTMQSTESRNLEVRIDELAQRVEELAKESRDAQCSIDVLARESRDAQCSIDKRLETIFAILQQRQLSSPRAIDTTVHFE